MKFLLALTAALVTSSCVVTRTTQPAKPEGGKPIVSHSDAAWRVLEDGELVGFARKFSPDAGDPSAPREAAYGSWYAVQNLWSQELGLVDELGRAWRLRPHHNGPDWLGTGTVAEGVAQVLGLTGPITLEEVSAEQR